MITESKFCHSQISLVNLALLNIIVKKRSSQFYHLYSYKRTQIFKSLK